MSEPSKGGLGEGVYFSPDSYAGLGRRFLIMAIDGSVVIALGIVLSLFSFLFWPEAEGNKTMLAWAGISYVYLAVLEASAFGTLGFIVTGVKILNLKGERPSVLRMSMRLTLWILGPFNPLIDLIWLGGDDFGQTLRDKFSGTVVVRRGAEPIGTGPIHVRYLSLLGFMMAFAEVQKPRTQSRH